MTGPIDLSLPRGASNLLTGEGDLQLTGDAVHGDPLHGRVPFRAQAGVITLDGARLEALKTVVSIDGSISPERRLDLSLKLLSEDLATTDDLGVRFRRAFGGIDPAPLSATGRGAADGRVEGTIDRPVFSGGF